TIVECKPIGVLIMEDGGARDEKIIAVPINDPNYNSYTDIDQLPSHRFDEIKHFFEVYKSLEHDKSTSVTEVKPKEEAVNIIQECIDSYIKNFQM
ncbi:MAG: inorganic diphosphatase, partial [Eubacterium sp.]